MGRLNVPKPRLLLPQRRLAAVGGGSNDRRRAIEQPWRKWYSTRRWQIMRKAVLERDLWTCQQTGELCRGKHPMPNSPVIDHIQPHNGDPVLFWEMSNLQTVSKRYHDSEKQRIEAAER